LITRIFFCTVSNPTYADDEGRYNFCLTSTTRGSDVRKRSKVRRTYNQKNLADLRSKFQSIGPKTDRLLVRFVAHEFAEEKAREYARHGFARRIQTLRRCIQNVFKIVSPTSIKTPSKAHRIPLYIPPGNVRPSDIDAYNDLTRRMTK
jgi:hypothetical protein